MPRNPRPQKPIASFGPELFRALIEGAKREIKLELPFRKAVHFRMRINQLRNQMRLQNHPEYSIASQAKITITWPEETPTSKSSRNVKYPSDPNTLCTVTILPSDSEFANALKAAGVEVPPLSDTTLPEAKTVEEDILTTFLQKE